MEIKPDRGIMQKRRKRDENQEMKFDTNSGDFDLTVSKETRKEWDSMFDEFDEEGAKICKLCGSNNIMQLNNGKLVCLNCKEEISIGNGIEIIDPLNCELIKIHRFKDEYYIKINTFRGHRFFRKVKGCIYEEFTYIDYDVFEQQSLNNKVDFSKALKLWLG